jgi:hypothetical protein
VIFNLIINFFCSQATSKASISGNEYGQGMTTFITFSFFGGWGVVVWGVVYVFLKRIN